MSLPRYEKDVTTQVEKCEECGKPAFDPETETKTALYVSPLSGHSQEVIGEDNKAMKVAVAKMVCSDCHAKDFKKAYPKAKAPKLQ